MSPSRKALRGWRNVLAADWRKSRSATPSFCSVQPHFTRALPATQHTSVKHTAYGDNTPQSNTLPVETTHLSQTHCLWRQHTSVKHTACGDNTPQSNTLPVKTTHLSQTHCLWRQHTSVKHTACGDNTPQSNTLPVETTHLS